MKKQEYIKIYDRYIPLFDELMDAELGRLVTRLLEYAVHGIIPGDLGNAEKAFFVIKKDIDEDKRILLGREIYGSRGEFHPNWRGGVTPENQRQRNSRECRLWRLAVFDRDNYTCQICGQRGGALNAHHIKPWAKYKEFRFDVDNGVTLCKKCHKTQHRKKVV